MVSELPLGGRLELIFKVGSRLIENTIDEILLISYGRNKGAKTF